MLWKEVLKPEGLKFFVLESSMPLCIVNSTVMPKNHSATMRTTRLVHTWFENMFLGTHASMVTFTWLPRPSVPGISQTCNQATLLVGVHPKGSEDCFKGEKIVYQVSWPELAACF
jgi:hypothetical protein